MSNNIHGKDKVDEIVLAWSKLEKVVTDNVNILERYSKSASNLPSDYVKQVEATRQAQDDLNKALEEAKSKQKEYTALLQAEERIVKKTAKVKADLANTTSKESKEYHKLNEAKKQADKLNRQEAKSLIAAQGLYNKVQKGINSITRQYNDLAIRKELNGKLSAQEQITLGKLEGKLNKYQKALINVDSRIQKHGRNVGNYKSGFDGLGFSVAQLSREMPAFANSMQTGFMAISNNIPMLTDEINKLKIANKELAASGKPTVSIFKSLGKAIFSWHSLISIGVTLLTVYGAKVFETIFAVTEEEKAIKEANKAMEEQNKSLKENIALRKKQLNQTKSFVNNTALLSEFQTVLNDLTKDSGKAEIILGELSERLEGIGSKDASFLKDSNILASDRLVIASNLLAIEEEKIKLEEERNKQGNIQIAQEKIIKDFNDKKIGVLERDSKLQALDAISLEKTIKHRKEINRLNQANQDIISKTIKLESDSNEGGGDNTQRGSVSSVYAGLEAAQGTENEGLIRTKLAVDEKIKSIKELLQFIPKWTKEYKDLEKQLHQLEGFLDFDIAAAGKESLDEWSKNFKEQQKELYEIQKEYSKKREDLEKQLGNNIKEIGYSVADSLFQIELNKLDERARLNEERANTALEFANGNAAAEARIKEQLADKQTAIEEKRIDTEKKAFLFNQAFKAGEIAIDTIKSVSALKTQAAILLANPVTAPLASLALGQIPLVIATGATAGAAVLAQSVPAFWMGTDSTPAGEIIVNDDPLGIKGNGRKEVIKEPNGKLHFPQGNNVKMRVPKGSTVYPNYDAFSQDLDSILNSNNIPSFSNDILKDVPVINVNNTGATAGDIDRIMSKHFSNIQTNQTIIDKDGIKTLMSKGNSSTIIHNNSVSFKGFIV